jgi:hypothetical protein
MSLRRDRRLGPHAPDVLTEAVAGGSPDLLPPTLVRPASAPAGEWRVGVHVPGSVQSGRQWRVPLHRRSRKPCCHSRHEISQALHDHLAQLEIPLSSGSCSFLVRPHVRAIEEHHPEFNPAVLNEAQEALPHTRSCPAHEDLGRSPPGSEFPSGLSATWRHSGAARGWLTRSAAGPTVGSCPWAGRSQSKVPAEPIVCR